MLTSASAFHAPAAVMGSIPRASASIVAEGDPGVLPSMIEATVQEAKPVRATPAPEA